MEDIVRHLAKNTFFQVLTKTITAGVTFIATLLIASRFGSEGYGAFTKVTALVSICWVAIDLGLNAIYLQEDSTLKRFGQLLLLRIGIAFVVVSVLYSILWVFPLFGLGAKDRILVIVYGVTIVAQAVSVSVVAIFQKRLRYDLQTVTILVGSSVALIGLVTAFYLYLPMWSLIGALSIGSIVTALTGFILVKSNYFVTGVDWEFLKRIVTKSLPLAGMLLCNLLYARSDVFFLSYYRTSSEVGVYGYAYRYFDLLIALPLYASNVFYPLVLRVLKNQRKLDNTIRKYIFVSIMCSIILLLLSMIVSPLIILIGPEFRESPQVLRLLLLSLPVFFLTSLLQWLLVALKKQRQLLYIYGIAAVVVIALNNIFIPRFGIYAAAIIIGIGELIVLILLIMLYKNHRMAIIQ